MNERTSDPLALISQHQLNRTPYQDHQPLYQQSQFQLQATSYQSSPYGTTYHNSQLLRTSLNPHQQATINNGRVTIQPIQGRQNFVSAGSSRPFTSGQGGAQGKQMVITCYNCKGEGADNRPPMLENDMYDSWKSRIELYMLNRPHGRMILESVE
nr:hypothetical protein [Tanacetum cinerariifolium]